MKNFKTGILLLMLLFSFLASNAQRGTVIRGRVIDKSDGSPIVGATIVEYDNDDRTVNGTITNVSGDFNYKLSNSSNKVVVRMIGYKSQEIKVDPSKTIIVELVSEDFNIGEVTVTAKSKSANSLTNIEDRDNASSTVKVDLMDMQDTGVLSAADALQGKVTGLDIIGASGDPGSGSQIVIRGLSSLGNNQPLIVIDGIPQFKVSSDFDLSSADTEDIGNLINVAMQDIKSIEVLKDAGSTAIFGSRGADGVLLIETKKGAMGKVKFDYQYKTSLNIQPPAIPMLDGNEYIMLQLEEWHNRDGIYDLPPEIAYDPDYDDFYNYSANTDWISAITQNAMTHDNYFSIQGGGNKTRFFASFGYVDQGGTTVNTSDKRFTSRVNLDYNISKKIRFSIKFDFSNNNTEGNIGVNWRNVRQMAYIKAPNMSIYEYDNQGKPTGEYFNPINSYQGDGISYFNPVAVANLGYNNKTTNSLKNTFIIQYRLKDWLILRETVALQYNGQKRNSFLPYNAIGSDWLNDKVNQAKETNSLSSSIRTETQLSFNSPFKSDLHSISGVVSWITDQSSFQNLQTETNRSASVDITDPASASQINWIGNNSGEDKTLRLATNLNYKYNDKYMVQGVLSLDARAAFGENNRWGAFKAVSIGWRFSDEPFLEGLSFLDDSKLRFSWGVTGRPPSSVYARFAEYSTTNNGSYINNTAIKPDRIALNNLKWQTLTSTDIGLELNLFKGRIYAEGDIYQKVTTDILFENYDIPQSSGFYSLRYFNGGEMLNKGWEVMFDAKIVRTKDWVFSVNFNTSRNINIFSKLPDNFNPERSTAVGNGDFPQLVTEGKPIGSFYGFQYLGVFPSDEDAVAKDANGNIMRHANGAPIPLMYLNSYTFKGGDPIYKDVNHDGKIDLNDVKQIGDSNPDFIGGFGTNLKYKNFTFSASFHYRLGFDIVNGIAMQTEGMNNRNNQSKAVLWRWRVQGQDDEGMLPRAYMNHPANNLGSDRYVEKGDFLRLNNMKFSYQLSQRFCDRIGVRKANFALSARKLMTFTNYSGQDPEVGQNASNPFWMGVDQARTPPAKIYTFTIGVGF